MNPLLGRPAAFITIGIKIGASWYPVEVYVDSGAAYSVLHAQIANGIGFDYRAGNRIYSQVGDGGAQLSLCPGWLSWNKIWSDL